MINEELNYLIDEMLINNEDYTDEIYESLNLTLIKKIESNILLNNLLQLYDEEVDIEDKITDELYQILSTAGLCIILFNKWEKYEYSQKIYNNLKDLYIQSVMIVEKNKINIKKLEEEFKKLLSQVIQSIEAYEGWKDLN